MKDIKILVCTTKPYRMPSDPVYLPIEGGRALHQNTEYIGDDTGDNISSENPHYSELSCMYWAWKNLKADAIGISHYRRHMTMKNMFSYKLHGKWNSILAGKQAEELLSEFDVIVPQKRCYYIETNYEHYVHTHHPKPLDIAIEYVKNQSSAYSLACDTVMNRTWAHMWNIFLMKRDKYDAYCSWLFDMLFHVASQTDYSKWNTYEQRVYSFLSERFLDVWLIANNIPYKEINVMHMESQRWHRKILSTLNNRISPKYGTRG